MAPRGKKVVNWKLVSCLSVVYAVWGSTYLAIKVTTQSLPPFLMASLRYFVAGAILFVALKLRGAPWPSLRQWRNAAVMGFLLVSVGNGLVCIAVGHISSGLAAVIYACGPVFTLLLDRFGGGRSSKTEWLGVGLGVVGVALLHVDDDVKANWVGTTSVLVASASTSIAIVLQPRLDMPRGLSAPVQMLLGALWMVPMAIWRGESWPAAAPLSAWLALGYLIVFGSMLAYSAYVYVLNHSGPALATSNEYVNAAIALLLGHLLLNEAFTFPMLTGASVILLGVILIALEHAKKAPPSRQDS